jgi:GNAT superfamily N-acetyltransferase
MRQAGERRPARSVTGLSVIRCRIPEPDLNHFFYTRVGRPWLWYGRLPWSRDDWSNWVCDPAVETYLALLDGTPAGYAEIHRQDEGNVELAYFGLLPSFIGRGLGGAFLARAVDLAWSGNTQRVWVHTCSLDHPAALNNYRARGFRLYREHSAPEDIPDPDDPIWHTPDYLPPPPGV